MLDVVVAILLGLGLIRGWVRGLVFQLGQIAVVVVAFLIGGTLGGQLEGSLVDMASLRPQTARTVGFLLVFGVVYAVLAFVLYRFTRQMRKSSELLSATDRWLGLVVGGAKAALLVYIGFVVLIMAHRITGSVPIPYASSVTGRWVMQYNFLDGDEFPRAKALVKLGVVVSQHETLDLVGNPHFLAILNHPKAAVLRSPAIVKALIDGDWMSVLGDERIWDLLDEPDIQEHLNAIEWSASRPPAPAPPRGPPAPRPPGTRASPPSP